MIYVCRPGGVLSVPGVYGGVVDKLPFGALMNKGLTLRTGQTHVARWTHDLLRRIEEGQIDPSHPPDAAALEPRAGRRQQRLSGPAHRAGLASCASSATRCSAPR